MDKEKVLTLDLLDIPSALLLGFLGAWLFMHIHLPRTALSPHETSFLNILAGTGPAPDQYRLLQNHLIGLLYRVMHHDLYRSVFLFTAASLASTIYLLLQKAYPDISRNTKQSLSIVLALMYPVVMYNGPRGDTAFILLLALGLAIAIDRSARLVFVSLLTLMAFTRADLALFAALFALLWKPAWFSSVRWVFVVALPLTIQGALQFIVFPEASYYCDVVMFKENLRIERVSATPAFILIAALLCLFNRRVIDFCRWLNALGLRGKLLILLFFGYGFVIFVIAVATEIRLFLPLAPFVLLLAQAQCQEIRSANSLRCSAC